MLPIDVPTTMSGVRGSHPMSAVAPRARQRDRRHPPHHPHHGPARSAGRSSCAATRPPTSRGGRCGLAMQRMDVGEESLHAGDDVAGPHGKGRRRTHAARGEPRRRRRPPVRCCASGRRRHGTQQGRPSCRSCPARPGTEVRPRGPGPGGGALVKCRVVSEGPFDDEALDKSHLAWRVPAEAVINVLWTVERYARPDRRSRS